ncbi:MAG: hypothetical protein NVS9B3_00150 [Gemmatimonadaceae bacterium]
MMSWLVAAAAGVAAAASSYSWSAVGRGGIVGVAALLRALAAALLVALLLDVPLGREGAAAPFVALDASASWRRATPDSLWRAAIDRALAVPAESVFVFGDSVRPLPRRDRTSLAPGDRASRVRPMVDRALSAGRALVVVTDGELDDAPALEPLPTGSRVIVLARPHRPDMALASLELPRAAAAGDTVQLRATVVAGDAGAGSGRVAFVVGDHSVGEVTVDSLAAGAERTLSLRVPLAAAVGPLLVRAIVSSAGDAEPRNDTVTAVLDVVRSVGAVFLSTAPDEDARFALAVLRGTLAIPTRGYFRVAPGRWRVDGTLGPIEEGEVRAALRTAPLAVIHGDTAIFGSPRAATNGPLALVVPQSTDGDWYVVGAPPSPMSSGLALIPFDSLPPLAGPARDLAGDWRGVEVALGRQGERRAIVAGTERPRRVAIVAASGLWRWQFRGGVSADAFTAFWGPVFDWLAAERADERAASPAEAYVREGDAVRWRRGRTDDSVVVVHLTHRGGRVTDTVSLRFPGRGDAESPALAQGIYDVDARGGRSLLVVNASREWLPRAVTAAGGPTGGAGAAVAGTAPTMRGSPWAYALALLILCAEWLLRRRGGMR